MNLSESTPKDQEPPRDGRPVPGPPSAPAATAATDALLEGIHAHVGRVGASGSAPTHTPGPWWVTGELDRIYGGELIRPGADRTARETPAAILCDFNRFDRDDERRQNAHLVAAAPELLSGACWALELITAQWGEFPSGTAFGDAYQALRAAIAKAGGELE